MKPSRDPVVLEEVRKSRELVARTYQLIAALERLMQRERKEKTA